MNPQSIATQGVNQIHEDLAHKDAEVVGLRASLRCSAKLLQVRLWDNAVLVA